MGATYKVTPEIAAKMQRDRDGGMTVKGVAEKYMVSEPIVKRHTKAPVLPYEEVSDKQKRAMQEARDHGSSLNEIAEEYGVSYETARVHTHQPKAVKFHSSGMMRERTEYRNPITQNELTAYRAKLQVGSQMNLPVMQYDEAGFPLGIKKELCRIEHVSRHTVVFRRPNGRPEHRTIVELCQMGRSNA